MASSKRPEKGEGAVRGLGGRPEKRAAIVVAARRVFGEHGLSRSSIEAIAGGAGVSTRTIYNHFSGKDELFATVLEESATQVADDFLAEVEGIADGGGLELRLLRLAELLVRQTTTHPEHFAMVRQISGEARHFPAGAFSAWREAGPHRVEAGVADYLGLLAERGQLDIDDRAQAGRHFIALTNAEVIEDSHLGEVVLSEDEARRLMEPGVRVFVHGYGRSAGAPESLPGPAPAEVTLKGEEI
jgi:AcrR family transcriptional regulator